MSEEFDNNMGLELIPLNQNRDARLIDREGDFSKRWYIEYYVMVEGQTELKRVKLEFGMNNKKKYPTVKDRYKFASLQVAILNKHLRKGVKRKPENSPLIDASKITFKEAVKYIVDIKIKTNRHRTGNAYSSFQNVVYEWIGKEKYDKVTLSAINSNYIYSFFDYLKKDREVSNCTYNNYLIVFKSVFNDLIKRNIVKENPVNSVVKLRQDQGRNIAYSDKQKKDLKPCINSIDPQLWRFVQFMYYSLMRPAELNALQVKHISKDKIYIPSNISKNKKSDYIVITSGLQKVIEEMGLKNYSPSDYVFSPSGNPSSEQVSRNYFSKIHFKAVTELKYDSDYTLYSWKHTGVVDLYNAGVGIKFIQMQCRHSSLEMTDKYLKSLGLFTNEELLKKAPEL